MKEALEDLLRYYRREAAGEEKAGRAAEEREVGQVCLAVAETWRRAAGLLEGAINYEHPACEEEIAERWRAHVAEHEDDPNDPLLKPNLAPLDYDHVVEAG